MIWGWFYLVVFVLVILYCIVRDIQLARARRRAKEAYLVDGWEDYRVDGWEEEVDFSKYAHDPRFPIERLDDRFRSAEGQSYGDPTL